MAAGYVFLVLRPVRVQAWREANEIAGRTLMRDGISWRQRFGLAADGNARAARVTDGGAMSMATRTDPQSPTRHVADSHDLIRVHGARENNLKDVSLEIPKRRLTVFTGVSGSGKSSLVFDTIAAESQRMINETYSAFVQGFMPTLARPDVDVLDGLTTAILVDQERMGSNPRSTVGTATDANAMLRILFSRLGSRTSGPRPPSRSTSRGGRRAGHERGQGPGATRGAQRRLPRRHAPALRGHGLGHRLRPDCALYDDSKSLAEGALTVPGYSMDGWYGRIFSGSGFFDMDKPIRRFTKKGCDLLQEPTKIKVEGINLTYEGLIPKIQKSMLSKDPEAMQLHIRAFVERAITFTTCPDCDGTRLSEEARSAKIGGKNIADLLRDADQRPGRLGPRPRRAVGDPAADRAAAPPRLLRRDRVGLFSRSTGRPAPSRVVRPSAPR